MFFGSNVHELFVLSVQPFRGQGILFCTKSNFALSMFVLNVENSTILVAILKGIEVRVRFKQCFVLSIYSTVSYN